MVDFYRINDWPLPVRDATFSESFQFGGHRGRRFSGVLRQGRRWQVRVADFETPMCEPSLAEAIIGLVEGQGNRWDFEYGHYSDKGYGPEAGHNGTVVTSAGYQGAGLSISSGGSYNLADVIQEPTWDGHWTVIAHFSTSAGTGFQRLLWRDNDDAGAGYADGSAVTGHGIENIFSYASGTGFTFKGVNLAGANAVTYWDFIVILPYRVTDSMAAVFSDTANTFSGLPFSSVRFNEENRVYDAVGEVSGVSYVQAEAASGWTQDMQIISITLETSGYGAYSPAAGDGSGPGFDFGFDIGFG